MMTGETVVIRFLEGQNAAAAPVVARAMHRAQVVRTRWLRTKRGAEPPTRVTALFTAIEQTCPDVYGEAQRVYRQAAGVCTAAAHRKTSTARIRMLERRLKQDTERYGTDAPRTVQTRQSLEREYEREDHLTKKIRGAA